MDTWMQAETAGVDLGDKRLRRRLQLILGRFSASRSGACRWPAPAGRSCTGPTGFSSIRRSRRRACSAATLGRMAPLARGLCVGDRTFLNYPGQRATAGLGPHTSEAEHGFLLHPLVACTPEGVCLGTLHWQSWARDPALGRRQTRLLRPIEQKASRCWGEEWRPLDLWREALPQTELLYLADRESDIYELLAQSRAPGVDLLIRAVRNRKTTAGCRLWTEAANWPLRAAGRQTLAVAARPGPPAPPRPNCAGVRRN